MPKYYGQSCLESFQLHITSLVTVQIGENKLKSEKNIPKKLLPTKTEGFQMLVFGLNQGCKATLLRNCYIWNIFQQLVYFIFELNHFICKLKRSEVMKKWRFEVWRRLERVMSRNSFYRHSGQNIWQNKKTETELDKNKRNVCFCLIFGCYCQSVISGEETEH